jgi:hypothetical protein
LEASAAAVLVLTTIVEQHAYELATECMLEAQAVACQVVVTSNQCLALQPVVGTAGISRWAA